MSKLRSVNTHFWSDNYVIDLDPIEKLLFLYLITNESTNMLGIYELHIRKIAFDTGIDKDMVSKIFDRFDADGKASYIDGYVCLHNFTKHQSYNENMKKSALLSFNDLPLEVRNADFIKPLLKDLKPFPKGCEPIAEIEVEYELEKEIENIQQNEIDLIESLRNVNSHEEAYKIFKNRFSEGSDAQETCYPFDDFWDEYDHKKERKKCERKWEKLSEPERETIKEFVPIYLAHTPDKQYRKYPSTFLNNEIWDDDWDAYQPKQQTNGKQSKGDKRAKQLREIREGWPQ